MASGINKLAKAVADILRRDDTDRGYDTTAEVKRIEDGTAWVHFPGGEDETPVRMTVNANVGDNVQVRVSGGRAFIIGNGTAPPTDDGKAKELHAISSKAIGVVKGVADKAFKIAGNTAQYFWTTEEGTDTGAHITEIPKESFEADPEHGGANLLLRSIGIAIRQGLVELASFSVAGMHVNTYDSQGNEVTIAHLGYGLGTAQSGTDTKPYYTLGDRSPNSTIGNWSVAEGHMITASGFQSHAEGAGTTASGSSSHAEGEDTVAAGTYSHAEGMGTSTASGMGAQCAHAEGRGTQAKGRYSHTEGYETLVKTGADAGHAGGIGTIVDGEAQTAIGKYNVSDTSSLFIVGNGTADSARSNAFKLSSGGAGYFASALGTGGKTAWNDTAHDGAWLSSTGEIHLTEQSASRGGTISFHFNRSASATTSLYEGTSGVLTNTGRLVTSDWSGTGRTPVSSATTDGGRISYIQATAASLRVAGQWGTAGGSYTITDFLPPTSDIRLKKNVEDCEVEDALSVINRIKLHSFDWLHTDEHQRIGFIADEMEGIDPKLAVGGGKEKDGTIHYKTVDTFYLLGYLTKAVQELSEQNAKLTAELNALKEVVK